MDYHDDPAEPIDKAAQTRAIDAVLVSGLILAAIVGVGTFILLFAPAWAEAEPVNLMLWGVGALAVLVHGGFQLHYVMRFMWARGEWVTLRSHDWGDHENYLMCTLVCGAAIAGAPLLVSGLHALLT